MPGSEREASAGTRCAPHAELTAWLSAPDRNGPERDHAVERLHALLRAAHFDGRDARSAVPQLRGEELKDVAMQAADGALMAVPNKSWLIPWRSRFTTWTYSFALRASVKVRGRAVCRPGPVCRLGRRRAQWAKTEPKRPRTGALSKE